MHHTLICYSDDQADSKLHSALGPQRACRVKSSIPIEAIFQELSVTPWRDFWWRQVLSFWNAMAQADSESIINIGLHDAIAIAHNGCSYGWAAQVFKYFAEHGKSSPLVAGAPVEVQPDELQLSFQMQRQAAFDAVPLDPRSCPGQGVKLCTYRRWFSRPTHQDIIRPAQSTGKSL